MAASVPPTSPPRLALPSASDSDHSPKNQVEGATNDGVSNADHRKPEFSDGLDHLDSTQYIERFKKYDAEYTRLMMAKYFSAKSLNEDSMKLIVADLARFRDEPERKSKTAEEKAEQQDGQPSTGADVGLGGDADADTCVGDDAEYDIGSPPPHQFVPIDAGVSGPAQQDDVVPSPPKSPMIDVKELGDGGVGGQVFSSQDRAAGKRPLIMDVEPSQASKKTRQSDPNDDVNAKTLWDVGLDPELFIREQLSDENLFATMERQSLQMAFLAHQGRRVARSQSREIESLASEKDKVVEAESTASSPLCDLKEKYKKKKNSLHEVRKEYASLKREFDNVSAARVSLVAEKTDLEKKHQEVQQSLQTIKSLHDQAISNLEAERKRSEEQSAQWGSEKAALQGEVANLRGQLVNMYNEGFSLAVQQISVIAPGVDVSRLSSQLVVRNCELVAPDVSLDKGNAPV